MLLESWIYIGHNLIITILSLEILRQLFYIRIGIRRQIYYVLWIQVVFIISDVFIQTNFPLEYKYPFIFLGFTLGYFFFLKLPFVSSIVVMIVNLIINGICTNTNIFILTLTQYESYGLALEHGFIQYSTLVMVMIMAYMIIKAFNIRILDITRYN